MTEFSHSCNGDHYWTIIIGGNGDLITLDRNYLHDVSGRAPKIGSSEGNQVVQAVNNLFSGNEGHNFDISSSGLVLIEGNAFSDAKEPLTSASEEGVIFTVPSGSEGTCEEYLGRACEANSLSNSGDFADREDTEPLSELSGYGANLVVPIAASEVAATVEGSAGIGKI